MNRIADLRKKHGYTAQRLAELCGVTDIEVYRWQSGERRPKISNLKRLCRLFDVTIHELYPDEEGAA